MAAVTGWTCTPIHPRVTWPLSFSWATTAFTVSAGMSKPMPTEPPDGEKIGCVDADDVALNVECRAAGIALVDRSVDLDEVVIRSSTNVAPARGNDACRDGAAKTKRIPDRDHPVADPGRMIGELHVGEVACHRP